jgi:uncharacterized protein (DUF4415 family)
MTEQLPAGFDAHLARVRKDRGTKIVQLKIDRDVFLAFQKLAGKRSHITLMQDVLLAYVRAEKYGKEKPDAPA